MKERRDEQREGESKSGSCEGRGEERSEQAILMKDRLEILTGEERT